MSHVSAVSRREHAVDFVVQAISSRLTAARQICPPALLATLSLQRAWRRSFLACTRDVLACVHVCCPCPQATCLQTMYDNLMKASGLIDEMKVGFKAVKEEHE